MEVSGDEFEPTDEEVAAEAALAPLVIVNSERWDRFLEWVRDIEVPWQKEDTDQYRRMRAVQYCNGVRAVSRDLLDLKPTMASWVPHIACNIVPGQIVELGDPSRRAADACESYGACAKRVIKHLTCRRAIGANYAQGYIAQAFRRLSVRSSLIHGVDNAPFLQRQDAQLIGVGRVSAAHSRVEGPHMSVRVKTEQEYSLA